MTEKNNLGIEWYYVNSFDKFQRIQHDGTVTARQPYHLFTENYVRMRMGDVKSISMQLT